MVSWSDAQHWLSEADFSLPAIPEATPPTPEQARSVIANLDLTTLQGDDHPERIIALCERAKETGVAAVCVYPAFVDLCRKHLNGTGIKVATVAGAFPHGLSTPAARAADIREAHHADEIDIVIPRYLALTGDWEGLYHDLVLMREAAGSKKLKVILATGELGTPERITKASAVAIAAGADFVKTSTGKESVNATLEAGQAMLASLRAAQMNLGLTIGLKPAGGIATAEDAWTWRQMVAGTLGEEATHPDRFRIGASRLLDDLIRASSA